VLESWDAGDHPGQRRMQAYLDSVLPPDAMPTGDSLVLELVVGLPDAVSLVRGGHDLDNYLFPIARRLAARWLDAAFGRKARRDRSTLAVERAVPVAVTTPPALQLMTTVSSSSTAWKWRVHDACPKVCQEQAPDGPLALTIALGAASRRTGRCSGSP